MIENNFICRICGSKKYTQTLSFDSGNLKYSCSNCSVCFDNPEQFSLPVFKCFIRPFKNNENILEYRGKIPTKLTTETDTGFDLYAVNEYTIQPNELVKFETNLTIIFPFGYGAEIRPRSGLSSKHKLLIINSPGTIDNEYTGDISVPILNLNTEPYTIKQGERIAQIVFESILNVKLEQIFDISDILTIRGENGFNSSGKF